MGGDTARRNGISSWGWSASISACDFGVKLTLPSSWRAVELGAFLGWLDESELSALLEDSMNWSSLYGSH